MSNLEFVIPANKLELLDCTSGSYYIEEVIPLNRLNENLKNAKLAFKNEGVDYILEYFPVYFSILSHSDKIQNDLLSAALYDTSQGLKQISINLDLLLEEPEIEPEIAQKQLKILKMLVYAYTNILMAIDIKRIKKQKDQLLMPSKGKGRKPSKNSFEEDDFDKVAVINLLMNILKKEISKLWDPPICEESFINIIADVLFSFMHDPSIKKDTDLQSLIFNGFGYLLKNYNYSLTFRVKIVQLIKSRENEHLTSFIPQGIKTLVEEYNCKSLVRELVRELTEWQTDENMQDAPGTKYCSSVLVEMTVIMPELMIPEVIYLIKYLNHESHTLRICILTIITEVIINVLCKEHMSDEEKEIRELLLKQLDMHIQDINAHVRSKVLQLWAKLQFEGAVPLNHVPDILEKATKRLLDRTVLVRKSAAALLTKTIECNPYAAVLNIDNYEKELQTEKIILEELRKKCTSQAMERIQIRESKWSQIADDVRAVVFEKIQQATQLERSNMEMNSEDLEYVIRMYLEDGKYDEAFTVCHNFEGKIQGMKESRKDFSLEEQIEFYVTLLHAVYCDLIKNTTELNEEIRVNGVLDVELQSELDKSLKNIQYYEDVIRFLKIVESATPYIVEMLESSTISDVTEAIEFFIVAKRFQIKGAMRGLEMMLDLINSDDKDRKNCVADAYKKLFLENDEKKSPKEFAAQVVDGLSSLLETINLTLLSKFGAVITEWMNIGLLNTAVIEYLWNMFTNNITDKQMTTKEVRVALQLLKFIGKGRPTILEKNLKLIAEIAFGEKGIEDVDLVITGCSTLAQIGDTPINVEDENPQKRIPNEDPMWENLTKIIEKNLVNNSIGLSNLLQVSVELVYKLCRYPDTFCEKLIRSFYPLLSDGNDKLDSFKLTAFIYLIGEVAVRQFTYLDITVYKEVKRRAFIREKREKKKNKNNQKSRASSAFKNANEGEESFMEGAVADDADSEFILRVCENEIVTNNLLGSFVPLIKKILKSPGDYNDENLQVATTLTMMRFMLISTAFCQNNMQFMMTILERTKFTGVKNNIIISIADLLNRYPNIINPWANHLYKCVRDPSLDVRITSVSIITNLLMENMLRVRGSIAEIALCIKDESIEIRETVKRCFYSLSQQNPNPIYNILPDIISNLSNESEQIDEDTFREVMKFLIKHIDKDKQMEPLVDKLCTRIGATINDRHLRDISYCLTLLNHTEKSLEKLIECYPIYRLKLENQDVLELFFSIVDKYKNVNKEEIKNSAKKLDEILHTGKTSEESKEDGDTQSTQNRRKPSNRKQNRKKRRS